MNRNPRRIGIVGTGPVGQVLSRRLVAAGFDVAVTDKDARKAKQFAKQSGTQFLYAEELVRRSEFVALCLPGDQVIGWLQAVPTEIRSGPLFVSLATALPTAEIRAASELQEARIVGLKPVAQFAALDRGLPGLFVTAETDALIRGTLEAVFGGLGAVVTGDEDWVGTVNREVTEAALRVCLELSDRSSAVRGGAGWVEAALKNVLVGTVLDYPPDPDNAYTSRSLATIRAIRGATGRED